MKKTDEVQVLLSIMNEKNVRKKLQSMNIHNNYVVINQVKNFDKDYENSKDNKNVIISLKEKGLSKSRNLALSKCTAKYAILADDDMIYVDNYDEIIKTAYEKNPKADVIAFIVEHENKKYEKKVFKEGKIGYIKSLKISSVQLTFKVQSIIDNKIRFDENFGSGSKYKFAEENIFLYDCLRKKLNIVYIPIKIGYLQVLHESGWFDGYNENFFRNRGASYYRMSKIFYPFLILQFAFRKKKLFKKIKVQKAIKNMFEGVNEYKIFIKEGY